MIPQYLLNTLLNSIVCLLSFLSFQCSFEHYVIFIILDLIELLEKLSDTGEKYSHKRSSSRDHSQSRNRSPSLRRRASSANTDVKPDYTQEQYEAVLKYVNCCL